MSKDGQKRLSWIWSVDALYLRMYRRTIGALAGVGVYILAMRSEIDRGTAIVAGVTVFVGLQLILGVIQIGKLLGHDRDTQD